MTTPAFSPQDEGMSRVDEAQQRLSVSIERKYAGFHLDIAFTVSGGLTVLFGPSGSGKSLTLQALAGLLPLDKAVITLGETVWQDSRINRFVPPQQRQVGYVPQNYALFPHLTVAQNIAFGMTKGIAKKEQSTRIAELVSLMQLDGLEHRRPTQLSGGQQQRVALARALAVNPCLLLLDEPFSALDAAVRESLREELRTFYERVRIPTLLVTHDMQEVQQLADTVVVIQQGRVLQVGSQREVFRFPQTPAAASLVGMRPVLQGIIRDVQNEVSSCIVTIAIGELRLHARMATTQSLKRGQNVELALRSDELELVDEQTTLPSSEHGSSISGVVIREHYRSPLHIATVELAPGVRVDVPVLNREWREGTFGVGKSVLVSVPVEAVHVFPDVVQ